MSGAGEVGGVQQAGLPDTIEVRVLEALLQAVAVLVDAVRGALNCVRVHRGVVVVAVPPRR